MRPLYESDRRKKGNCRLCGEFRQLTKTHVPAQSAGNVGPGQAPMIVTGDDGQERYGLGREALGGMWLRAFCGRCNNRTREWDEEYPQWCPALFNALHDPKSTGNRLESRVIDCDPGAFVRCLWAWAFALSDTMRPRYPQIADAVLSGQPVAPPTDSRLLLAATRDLQFGIQVLSYTIGVTAPPYVMSHVAQPAYSHRERGWFNTGLWLIQPAGVRQTVEIALPIVHTFDEGDLPPVGEPVLDPLVS